MKIDYTINTKKSFDNVVNAVIAETEKAGFKVLYIHDVKETLEKKGFTIEPLKIIEICNANHAFAVLKKDINLSLFLPCKINVYTKNNKTYISAFKPEVIQEISKRKNIASIIEKVNNAVISIVQNAGGEKDYVTR